MSDSVQKSVASARAQLESTLDAIDERLDVQKRASELADNVKRSYQSNPVPWIIGATAAAVVVAGVVAWAIFSDD